MEGYVMKILKLMPDHCSSGLWDEEGINLCYDTIGHKYNLNYDLISGIACWQAWYDRENGFCDDDGFESDNQSYYLFQDWGRELADELRIHMEPFGVEVVYAA